MNYKKKIALPVLLAILSLPAFAAGPDFHAVSLAGFEPYNRYGNYHTNVGASLAQELYISPNDLFSFGLGVRYMFPRSIDDFNEGNSSGEKLAFIPLYGALKINLPVENIPLYAKLAAGYNFVQGNPAFNDGKDDIKGGFYYSVGAGADVPFHYTEKTRLSFIFDMGWSSNTVSWATVDSKKTKYYMSLDLLAGLGVRF